ncbi:MAG: 7,8-dihydro-8-oxoguanine triphosphatase, partial [Chloroflexi bacterium]|nr:7,8-dihydro-8-oxoguanine triphosphatase [Chloroflexota bacterium]
EILEESGLIADRPVLRGTISWPGFGKNGEDWFGFIFRIESWHGEVHAGNHEGTLEWISLDTFDTLPMWPSDRNFLPMVFDADARLFHGCMPFHNGQMQSWSYTRV